MLQGNNNDVERRYKHYVENSPSEPKNILEKVDAEKRPDRDAALIEKSQQHEDNTDEEREQQEIQYEKSVEKHRRKKKMMVLG